MKAKTVEAQVEQITPLTDTIMQLMLKPETYVDYQAGQYLQIFLGEEALNYSIANAPLGSHQYELHIRHSSENPYTQRLFAHIKEHGNVTMSLPFGECSINRLDKDRPILFIARGTGFAPVKAMIEQLLANTDNRTFELFWGARMQNDLYMDEKVTHWQKHVRRFTYFSSCFDEHSFKTNYPLAPSGERLKVKGNSELLISLVLARHPSDLADWQIILSGPFDMVYSTRDVLVQKGVSQNHLFSDAFSFEVK
jgi:CDP-4-dehydro-6-deoxyglucose reductase